MATHSSMVAWRIPCTKEPGGLHSTGLHSVRHDCRDLALHNPNCIATHSFICGFRLNSLKWKKASWDLKVRSDYNTKVQHLTG